MGYNSFSLPQSSDMEEAVPLTTQSAEKIKNKKGWVDDISPHLEPYLKTTPTKGLTQEQVYERLKQFGRNELPEKKRNKILHFLSFCKVTKYNSIKKKKKEIETYIYIYIVFIYFSYWCNCISYDNIYYFNSHNKRLVRLWYHFRYVNSKCFNWLC